MVTEKFQVFTPEETVEVLREDVRRVYNMSLEEFRAARAAGTLPRVPHAARDMVEMMLGDSYAGCVEAEGFDAS